MWKLVASRQLRGVEINGASELNAAATAYCQLPSAFYLRARRLTCLIYSCQARAGLVQNRAFTQSRMDWEGSGGAARGRPPAPPPAPRRREGQMAETVVPRPEKKRE